MKKMADVASYQPKDLAFFQALKAAGISAVVVKLTEGTTYINPKAQDQILNARLSGLLVHGYHYARFNGHQEARQEAHFFLENAKQCGLDGSSVLVLDAEAAEMSNYASSDCNAFFEVLLNNGFEKIDIYSMKSWFMDGHLNRSELLAKNYWVASYGTDCPGLDRVGTWQYTSEGYILGHQVDLSYDFFGYYTDALPSKKTINPPADVGWVDDLGDEWYPKKGYFKLNEYINLRWGARTSSMLIATLEPGDVVIFDAYSFHDGYCWIRQPRANQTYGYLATGEALGTQLTHAYGEFI